MKTFDVPVLFLIFNRPDTTEQVFEQIRKIRPSRFFIAADGPRLSKPGEAELCRKIQDMVLSGIDWECEVKTLFRVTNLGCGPAVSTAISWFFDHVEQGIILEDDCLPAEDFFSFSREILGYYKNDERIMMISGTNMLETWKENLQSYHFSHYGGIWGWASWRRAWNFYDYEIKAWADSEVRARIKDVLVDEKQFRYRAHIFDSIIHDKKAISWDYQWGFSRLLQSGLSIVPSKNLISNIGFGKDATHTKTSHSSLANLKQYTIDFPLKHPKFVIPDRDYDKAFMKKVLNKGSLIKRVTRKIMASIFKK